LPAAKGDPTSSRPVNWSGVSGRWDPEADEPLDGFAHDIDFTRFDSRYGRPVPLALAGLVAIVAANAGAQAAAMVGFGVAIGLGLIVAAVERDRWRAQDVYHWHGRQRRLRWIRETGGLGPGGDPVAAEIWLGTHQPGTVPQVFRSLAAFYARDPVVVKRELDAMPERTPEDRAWKEWVVQVMRLHDTGVAETVELGGLVGSLEPSADRSELESWLAMAEAASRWTRGDRAWIRSLADQRPRATRTALGFRRRARIWVSRFAVVIVFAIPAFLFSSFSLAIAEHGDPIPPEYAQTTYGIRGDLPRFDDQAAARTLPALARSLAGATRVQNPPLDDDSYNALVDASIPTFTWITGKIEIEQPADLRGHRIWSVEVLLGGQGQATSGGAIVIVDDADGPAYFYRIDPGVLRSMREAAGLPVPSPAP
jgi:hypothetical protein